MRTCIVSGIALCGFALCGPAAIPATAAPDTPPPALTVHVNQPGAPPTQFGIFFEDINYGADGGLYPERVKNRSFEFTAPLMGWQRIERDGAYGAAAVLDQSPLHPNNPHYLRLTADPNTGGFGLSNEGFFGIGVRRNSPLTFSVWARSADPSPPALVAELEGPAGRTLASARLGGFTRDWRRYTVTLRPNASEDKASLNILLAGRGSVDLDLVSLFPRDTWKRRPNGLRSDLVQLLADLKPAFVRFPGGCIVEGRRLSTRYQWKTTIGPLTERRLIINRWNDEFAHRPAPDYFQSFGLGFYEYFQLCEDIGAAPMPILNCGMACQFNTGELVPLDQLDPYIQDALDLIEFANGPPSSRWGSRRAAMGHRAPFRLTMLGIGNENWGPEYLERYARFATVLKARHPEIRLISSAGPQPADDRFQFAWPKLRELKADIIDEHCYDRPEWFFNNAHRYDSYDRAGPKVFMGEFAAQSVKTVSPQNRNNWECALAEAAYMTGLERNGGVVTLASYAPLLAHVEGWQWTPNLIWFDNLRSFATPSYYVQQLFGVHRGQRIVPIELPTGPAATGLYASAVRDDVSRTVVVRLVNASEAARDVTLRLRGLTRLKGTAQGIVLASDDLQAENSLDQPDRVAPVRTKLSVPSEDVPYHLSPRSLTVLKFSGTFR